MMLKRIEENLQAQLPLYLTGRLPFPSRRIVEAWLRRSPEARLELETLRALKSGLEQESGPPARPAVWPRLDVRSSANGAVVPSGDKRAWGLGMVLGLLLFAFAWFAIPPAVELQWSVFGPSPKEFRVYRAAGPESASFELVEAIPVNAAVTSYRFRDYQLFPGRAYSYRIEAIGQNDEALADDWIAGDSTLALPGQLALITAGLISLYGLWVYLDRTAAIRQAHLNGRTA